MAEPVIAPAAAKPDLLRVFAQDRPGWLDLGF
jgi:hypothetical protein